MKIAIIGYGKMGKTIDSLAQERGHEVVLKIDQNNTEKLSDGSLRDADCAIEFSTPEHAKNNILKCFEFDVPVVVGTTGWYHEWESVKEACDQKNASLLTATNFSVGVNLFFELNRKLAEIIKDRKEYQAGMVEIHHTEKLDSPSGTAISLAEDLIKIHPDYQQWVNQETETKNELGIKSIREAGVPGTHTIKYESEIDEISISHEAKNRKGFALGAIIAAEYLADKKGVFTMKDVLNF